MLYLIWECLAGSQINLAEEGRRVTEKALLCLLKLRML